MKKALVAAAALVLLLTVSGCQSGTAADSAVPPIGVSMLPTAVPSEDESEPADDIEAHDGLGATCSGEASSGVERVVAQQLAAFKAEDFDAAFALASAQFQAITTAQGLRDLILDGRHQEVADSAGHEFTECRQPAPDQVLAGVAVTGANGRTVQLVYQFVREGGEWRILQSAPMDGRGGSTGGPAPSAQPV
jgi:hypothetical protein